MLGRLFPLHRSPPAATRLRVEISTRLSVALRPCQNAAPAILFDRSRQTGPRARLTFRNGVALLRVSPGRGPFRRAAIESRPDEPAPDPLDHDILVEFPSTMPVDLIVAGEARLRIGDFSGALDVRFRGPACVSASDVGPLRVVMDHCADGNSMEQPSFHARNVRGPAEVLVPGNGSVRISGVVAGNAEVDLSNANLSYIADEHRYAIVSIADVCGKIAGGARQWQYARSTHGLSLSACSFSGAW